MYECTYVLTHVYMDVNIYIYVHVGKQEFPILQYSSLTQYSAVNKQWLSVYMCVFIYKGRR